jgi:hypothetical protein
MSTRSHYDELHDGCRMVAVRLNVQLHIDRLNEAFQIPVFDLAQNGEFYAFGFGI